MMVGGAVMPSLAERHPAAKIADASGAGQRFGNLFHIEFAPTLVTTSFRAGNLALTEIKSSNPITGVTTPVPVEDAYLLALLMKDMINYQAWENGSALPRRTFKAGESMLRDLKKSPAALIDQPHHHLFFHLPRSALDELAADVGAKPIEEMAYRPDETLSDPIVKSLGAALQPALAAPEHANRLFLEHVLRAMSLHLATTYGGMKSRSKPLSGGLAVWQEKRAKEMLVADLSGNTPVAHIAQACGLSISQFTRAFKQSTGVAPHRWLILHRVETAKRRVADRSMRLADVALACGFADQSHLTRVFASHTGLTPAEWRRSS